MKKIVQILTLVILAAIVITACSDNFSEKDFLNQQAALGKDSVALSIQVYNGTISARSAGGRVEATNGLADIAISITADGRKKTAIADADGSASFFVQAGSVSGTLSGTGFTTVNFTLTVSKDITGVANSVKNTTNASVILPVFETTGPRVSRVNGTLTAELNLLNATRENAPDGVTIAFTPNFLSTTFLDAGSSTVDIDKFSVEGTYIATVAGGAYSINLPTAVDGIDYTFAVSDFTADQTLAINNFENEIPNSVRASSTISTAFNFGSLLGGLGASNFTTIPSLNAVQLDIEAPPAAFTTAATATNPVLAPQDIDGPGTGGFTVLSGGSGYPISSSSIGVSVTPVGGAPTINAILYAISNANGQITGIQPVGTDPDAAGPLSASTYGTGYLGRATLSIPGGSGAIVVPNYVSTLASITLANGAGYVLAPTLSVRGLDINGNAVEDESSTTINGGAIVSFTTPGQLFASITSMSFRAVNRARATATGAVTVNTFGQITALPALATNGSGYNPNVAPLVTVRNLRTGGSGAIVIAEMSANTPGSVANILLNDGGTGYTVGVANFPIGTIPFSVVTANGLTGGNSATPTILTSLRPGLTRTLNLYAGTGTRTRGVE